VTHSLFYAHSKGRFRHSPIGRFKVQNEKEDGILPVRRFSDWQTCPECHAIPAHWDEQRGTLSALQQAQRLIRPMLRYHVSITLKQASTV
jgi:hypothetical protein